MRYKVTYADKVQNFVEADSFNEATKVAFRIHPTSPVDKVELIAESVFEDIFRAFKMI